MHRRFHTRQGHAGVYNTHKVLVVVAPILHLLRAMADSMPPSPLLATDALPAVPSHQGGLGSGQHGTGSTYFSIPFERFAKDEFSGWTTGFTLLGESFAPCATHFVSHVCIVRVA